MLVVPDSGILERSRCLLIWPLTHLQRGFRKHDTSSLYIMIYIMMQDLVTEVTKESRAALEFAECEHVITF